MKDTVWDSLEFECKFALRDFDRDSFLKGIREFLPNGIKSETQREFNFACNSLQQPNKQHAHIDIKFLSQERGELGIGFYSSKMKGKDIKPPYMEDCVQWIGKFFRVDEMQARIRIACTFSKDYSPIITLPFPLVTESKELAGTLVSGLTIELVGRTQIRRAIIQKINEKTFILGSGRTRIKLKSFDFESELVKLSAILTNLIKQKERINDSTEKAKRRIT